MKIFLAIFRSLFLAIWVASASACGSWQGSSYDRDGNQHYGSGADWNKGNGVPGSGGYPPFPGRPDAKKVI